jgi:hypothetical protein
MSALLRRAGLFLVVLANRLEQRSRITLALEPLGALPSTEEALYDLRHRSARYY